MLNSFQITCEIPECVADFGPICSNGPWWIIDQQTVL